MYLYPKKNFAKTKSSLIIDQAIIKQFISINIFYSLIIVISATQKHLIKRINQHFN